MKILVAVKQVLDPEAVLEISADGRGVVSKYAPRYQLNHFDEFALEEAIRLKEKVPDSIVEVITIGPGRAGAVLERALGMGADRGVHILVEEDDEPTSAVVASWLAQYARERGHDLILTGAMAEDDLEARVGPALAEMLGLPCAASASLVELSDSPQEILAEREIEGGRRQRLALSLPAAATLQSSLNKPRYPTLSGLLRAKKMKPETIPAAEFTRPAVLETVVQASFPQKRRAGVVLTGSPQEKAAQLAGMLRERKLI